MPYLRKMLLHIPNLFLEMSTPVSVPFFLIISAIIHNFAPGAQHWEAKSLKKKKKSLMRPKTVSLLSYILILLKNKSGTIWRKYNNVLFDLN